MKKWYIIAIIILIVLSTIVTIIYKNMFSKINNTIEENEIVENMINSNIEIVSTSSEEEKVSPDCKFIYKIYYKKCGHTKIEKENVSETIVNKTKEDIKSLYKNWSIAYFDNKEIILYKEEDKECGEHYIIKELDGYVTIYKIDEDNNLKIEEITQIATKYLTKEDFELLQDGIRVNGKQELNQVIEDFE